MSRKLKLSEYDMQTTLGTGSFGRVKLAKHKQSGKYWAAKILKKAEIIKLKQVDHIMNEVNILTQVQHPFIVSKSFLTDQTSMDGFTQDEKYLYLMLEFIRGGELFTYLRGKGKFEPA